MAATCRNWIGDRRLTGAGPGWMPGAKAAARVQPAAAALPPRSRRLRPPPMRSAQPGADTGLHHQRHRPSACGLWPGQRSPAGHQRSSPPPARSLRTPPYSPAPGTAGPTSTGRSPCASGCARCRQNTPRISATCTSDRSSRYRSTSTTRLPGGRASSPSLITNRSSTMTPSSPRGPFRHMRHHYLRPPGTPPPPADLFAIPAAPHVSLRRAVDPAPVRGGLAGQRALQQILGHMLIAGGRARRAPRQSDSGDLAATNSPKSRRVRSSTGHLPSSPLRRSASAKVMPLPVKTTDSARDPAITVTGSRITLTIADPVVIGDERPASGEVAD